MSQSPVSWPQPVKKSPEVTPASVLGVFRPGWFKAVTAMFAVELAAFFLLTLLPMSASQVQVIAGQGNNLVNSVHHAPFVLKIAEIFTNNFRIASIEFIPVVGWFLYGYSTFSTAQVIEAFAIQAGLPGPYVMLSLLLLPHSWLELPAYAIAVTQSAFLVRSIFKGSFKLEFYRTLLVWGFVGLELLIAAVFESTEIQLQQPNPVLPFVTWIPFFVLAGVIGVLARAMNKRVRS